MINLEKLRNDKILGCGCSTFGGSVGKKTALRTLDFCYDNDIIYYDVARSYGYGQAESIVSIFARNKRDKIIITSKFGIDAPRSFPLKGLLTTAARIVKNNVPYSKKILKKAAGQILQKRNFSPAMVVTSLDKSLAELKTDYLDLYLFHECTFDEMLNEDIKDILNQEKAKGKIREWGVNLPYKTDQIKLLESNIATSLMQIPFALDDIYTALSNRIGQITVVYSIMNFLRGLQNPTTNIDAIKSEYPELKDLSLTELLLYITFQELPSGVVLMSTTNKAHILNNIKVSHMPGNSRLSIEKLHNLFKQ